VRAKTFEDKQRNWDLAAFFFLFAQLAKFVGAPWSARGRSIGLGFRRAGPLTFSRKIVGLKVKRPQRERKGSFARVARIDEMLTFTSEPEEMIKGGRRATRLLGRGMVSSRK